MKRSHMLLRPCGVVLALLGCVSVARAQGSSKAHVPPETESAVPGTASDPLRAFPPAPPPVESGAPEQPTTALTSFAPAPEPPPGGAPRSAAATGELEAVAPNPGDEPAAVSGSVDDDHISAPYVPSGEQRWSAAALFGVGVTFDKTVAGVNPLGFGFGVHLDYRVLPKWSLGARMLYFVGGSVQLPTSDVAMQSWLLAAEAAYVIEVSHVAIQPGLALGLHVRETDYRGFAGLTGEPQLLIPPDSTRFGLYVAPGVNLSVPLGLASASLAPLIAGADVRLDLAFGHSVTSNVQLLVLVGFQF